MYTPVVLSFLTILTGLLANGMTLQAKTLELDTDSIGSQERYYNGWTTPVRVWSLHYAIQIGFICVVMFALAKAGSTDDLDEQTQAFDKAAKQYAQRQLESHTEQVRKEEQASDQLQMRLQADGNAQRMVVGSHNEGEMLLNSDAVKTSFFNGKPSDEANQLNHGMVKTFMSMSQPVLDKQDRSPSSFQS